MVPIFETRHTASFNHPLFHVTDGAKMETMRDSCKSGIPFWSVFMSFQVTPLAKALKGVEMSSHTALT